MTTAYLDLANWIDLAEERQPRDRFEKAVEAGEIQPVLSSTHLLEIAAIEDQTSRRTISEYMKRVSRLGDVKWSRPFPQVHRQEAHACYLDWVGLAKSPVRALEPSFRHTLGPGGLIIDGTAPVTVPGFVEAVRRTDQVEHFRETREEYPVWRLLASNARSGRRFTDDQIRTFLAAELPDAIENALLFVPISTEDKRRFSEEADLGLCPSFRAFWAFHDGANLDPSQARPNDVADCFHLVGPAYCDVAFVDGATRACLERGQYDPLPRHNGEFPEWVENL